jgi:hypothetical protein
MSRVLYLRIGWTSVISYTLRPLYPSTQWTGSSVGTADRTDVMARRNILQLPEGTGGTSEGHVTMDGVSAEIRTRAPP